MWQRLPLHVRQRLFQGVTYPLALRRSREGAFAGGPVVVCGPLNSSNGIGWGARANLALLTEAGYDACAYDVSNLLRAHDLDYFQDGPSRNPIRHAGAAIFHLNPNIIPYTYLTMERTFLKNRYLVGYWVWEVDDVPDLWAKNLELVHEVWTPSTFSAEILRKRLSVPVRTIPHPIVVPDNLTVEKARHGIPDDRFVVLTMCHVSSGLSRKNPIAAIEAFARAFDRNDKVVLVVKVSHGHLFPERLARINSAAEGRPNVQVLEETVPDEEYWSLLNCADAVVSLHRAEGFGLVLAQAMALAKPVVATDWSANRDFMDDGNSYPVRCDMRPVVDPEGTYSGIDAVWAEPDLDHAAEQLRRLVEDETTRREKGLAASSTIRHLYSHKAVLDRVLQTEAIRYFAAAPTFAS